MFAKKSKTDESNIPCDKNCHNHWILIFTGQKRLNDPPEGRFWPFLTVFGIFLEYYERSEAAILLSEAGERSEPASRVTRRG